jgi:succinyl-CoA synthetase beta subunit
MYLLEHDAKTLLAGHGMPVPAGVLCTSPDSAAVDFDGPWIVKAQITAGGRGKAGLVRKAATREEIRIHAGRILGQVVKGKRVESVRIERQVEGAEEAYIGLLIDAAAGGVRVIVSAAGGMEIEALPASAIRTDTVRPRAEAIVAAVARLVAGFPTHKALALRTFAAKLGALLIEREALLIEINPLFVLRDGTGIAGDAKIVTDDNALERQPALRALLAERAAVYPEVALKIEQGFDYVIVDPQGDVGLLTTGAGLSMMLIDELRAGGLRPYNFLDIRTGGFRGRPDRLIRVLTWLADAPDLKVVLINIFGGIAHMGEFSKLLVTALKEVPALAVPIVARLAGNGLPEAREVLGEAGIPFHEDLDEAVAEVRRCVQRSHG